MTEMTYDDNGSPIPCLTFKDDGAHAIAFTGTAANNSTAFKDDTVVISLYATSACYVKLSDSSGDDATSSDHYFPAGIYYNIHLGGRNSKGYAQQKPSKKYISAIQVDTGGTLYVSEFE